MTGQKADGCILGMPHSRPMRLLRHRWQEAQTALRFLHDDVDGQTTLIASLRQHVDLSLIADDLQEFVGQITGVEAEPLG